MSAEANAVYFAPGDYASVPRRVLAFLLDVGVVFLFIILASLAAGFLAVPRDVMSQPPSPERDRLITKHMGEHAYTVNAPLALGWMLVVAGYHTLGKMRHGRTLGHLLTGLRVVDARGESPRFKVMLKRFLIALPACGMFGLSYFVCRRDPKRQATHDQWAGTWVVRRRAKPAGAADVTYQTKFFGTLALTYMDVEPAAPPVAVGADGVEQTALPVGVRK